MGIGEKRKENKKKEQKRREKTGEGSDRRRKKERSKQFISSIDVNREEIAAQSCPALTSLVSASATLEPATWQRILQLLYNVSVDGERETAFSSLLFSLLLSSPLYSLLFSLPFSFLPFSSLLFSSLTFLYGLAGARLKVRESDLLQHVVKCLANPNAQLVNLAAGALASYNARKKRREEEKRGY